ncbi:MAG: OsmC family protein [Polyangiales bacterium]
MSEHVATVTWTTGSEPFTYDTFSRAHALAPGSGGVIAASAAAEFHGDPGRTNPEELLVGALASCHMLTFLSVAARKRLAVVRYEDRAVGTLAKNEEGRLAVTDVVLTPKVEFGEGVAVSTEELRKLHDLAHRNCFIASSVRCRVRIDLG